TGHKTVVTDDAGIGPYRWLRAGGIAYVNRDQRLVVRGTTVGPKLDLSRSLLATVAISPDGKRLLYTTGCDVWLANARTGSRSLFIHGFYESGPDSWSPTGRFVVLGRFGCRPYDDHRSPNAALFDSHGRRLDGNLAGEVTSWSDNDRYLLTCCGEWMGTDLGPLEPLVLSDLK